MRGVLDGHIVLSRTRAARGCFPAVDVLQSVSRVAEEVCDAPHRAARLRLRRLLAAYAESEELIRIGAYARGSSPETDAAIAIRDRLEAFLQQAPGEREEYPHTCRRMLELAGLAQKLSKKTAIMSSSPA